MDKKLKFIIAVVYDLVDFFSIPIFGTLWDVAGGFLALWLWGPIGAVQFLELVDPTDQVDKFVPTVTIAGLISEGGLK